MTTLDILGRGSVASCQRQCMRMSDGDGACSSVLSQCMRTCHGEVYALKGAVVHAQGLGESALQQALYFFMHQGTTMPSIRTAPCLHTTNQRGTLVPCHRQCQPALAQQDA